MTYYQFIHAVEEKIKKEVKEERKISVHTNIKNNGVKRTGIMISENGINISPTIYLEEYFQQFKRGYPLELIVKDILSLYEKIRFQNSWKEGEKVKSYDFVKGRIIYRLVNRERNRKLLEDVPYKEYLDLAIVYYVLLEMDEYGMASMLVRREHLKMWICLEKLAKNWKKTIIYFQAAYMRRSSWQKAKLLGRKNCVR